MTTPKKTTTTKVAKSKAEEPLWKKKEVFVVDWLRLPTGTKIKAKVDGKIVEGRIFNNSENDSCVYICQNVVIGAESPNKLGFAHSWAVSGNGNEVNDVIYIELDPDFSVPEAFTIDRYSVIFQKGKIKVGCQTISNKLVRKIAANLQD